MSKISFISSHHQNVYISRVMAYTISMTKLLTSFMMLRHNVIKTPSTSYRVFLYCKRSSVGLPTLCLGDVSGNQVFIYLALSRSVSWYGMVFNRSVNCKFIATIPAGINSICFVYIGIISHCAAQT